MLFPLDIAPPEPTGDGPLWPLIILAVVVAVVIFFMIVQLRRILRSRRDITETRTRDADDRS